MLADKLASRLTLTAQNDLRRMLALPWCWPPADDKLAGMLRDRLKLGRPMPRSGEVLLVTYNVAERAALWHLSYCHGPEVFTRPFGRDAEAALRIARERTLCAIPVLYDLRKHTAMEWSATLVAQIGKGADATLDDRSFGLAAGLAFASYLLDIPVPSDLACSATVAADGSLVRVNGLEEKADVLGEVALGVGRVLVAADQHDAARAFAAYPRIEVVHVSSVAAAIEIAFGDVERTLRQTWSDRDLAKSALESATRLVLGHPADVPWDAVERASKILVDCFEADNDRKRALQTRRLAHIRLAQASPAAVGPYRGLASFREEDEDAFFGRDDLVEPLASKVLARDVVTVYGHSGSGKTSLVRAKIVPRILRAGLRVVPLRPGREPELALARAVGAEPNADPGEIVRCLRALAPVVVLVDQAEELFALAAPAKRDAFAERLAAIVDSGAAKLVVVVRVDFFGATRMLPALGDLCRDRTRADETCVDTPGPEALRAALIEPARRAGLTFEDGLIDTIVEELRGQRGALPLLQCCAQMLWEHDRTSDVLRWSVYEAIGRVGGALGDRADGVLAKLPPKARAAARRILVRLVTERGTRAVAPQDALREALGDRELAGRLIDELVDGRIITRYEDDDGIKVELIHEALVQHWQTMRELLEDVHLRAAGRVGDAAARWLREDRSDDLLLRPGKDAEDARALLELGLLEGSERDYAERSLECLRRRRRRGRALVAAVFIVLASAAMWSLWKSVQASRSHRAADVRLAVVLKERGRAELEAHNPRRASAYLAAAYGLDPGDPSIRLMLRAAMKVLELPTVALGRGAEAGAFLPDGHVIMTRGGALEILTASGDYVARLAFDQDVVAPTRDPPPGAPYVGRLGPEGASSRDTIESWGVSPDGRHIATGTFHGTVAIWNVDGRREATIVAPAEDAYPAPIVDLAYTADGAHLVTAHHGANPAGNIASLLDIHDLRNQTSLTNIPVGDSLRSGARVVESGLDAQLIELGSMKTAHLGGIEHAWTLDGRTLIARTGKDEFLAYDANGELRGRVCGLGRLSLLVRIGHSAPPSNEPELCWPRDVAFDSAGRPWRVLYDCPYRQSIWDCTKNDTLRLFEATRERAPGAVARFSASGRFIVLEERGHVELLDAATAEGIMALDGTSEDLEHATLSADDSQLLTWGTARTELRTVARAEPSARLKANDHNFLGPAWPNQARPRPSAPAICFLESEAASPQHHAVMWEPQTGKRYEGPPHSSQLAAIACDGERGVIATSDVAGSISVWNVRAGTRMFDKTIEHAQIVRIAFDDSGALVAAASRDGRVWIWSNDGRQVGAHALHDNCRPDDRVECTPYLGLGIAFGFQPGTRRLLIAAGDGPALLGDPADLSHALRIAPGGLHPAVAAFLPTGDRLLLGADERAYVVDPRDGAVVWEAAAHAGWRIQSASFAPDGSYLRLGWGTQQYPSENALEILSARDYVLRRRVANASLADFVPGRPWLASVHGIQEIETAAVVMPGSFGTPLGNDLFLDDPHGEITITRLDFEDRAPDDIVRRVNTLLPPWIAKQVVGVASE